MRILNLYAGLGGNRKHWNGDVTAIEIDPKIAAVYKSLYPNDTVIVGDALEYLQNHYSDFDFIWSSPKCQTHTRMALANKRFKTSPLPDMSLYQQIIFLTHFFKGRWVVENVKPYYEPLIKPSATLGRHLFWSNFEIPFHEPPTLKNFINLGTVAGSEILKDWLGIQYEGNIYYEGAHCPSQVLRNAVHPETGLHIFNSLPKELFAY